MEVSVRAVVDPGAYRVEATVDRGHVLLMDLDAPAGADAGGSPTDALLAALAACTAMDVASILRKKRQSASRYEVVVRATKAEDHPRVFTHIRLEHQVWGEVDAEALRRSVELSATRYCPVNAMLAGTVVIEHGYRLHAAGREVAAMVVVIGPGHGPVG